MLEYVACVEILLSSWRAGDCREQAAANDRSHIVRRSELKLSPNPVETNFLLNLSPRFAPALPFFPSRAHAEGFLPDPNGVTRLASVQFSHAAELRNPETQRSARCKVKRDLVYLLIYRRRAGGEANTSVYGCFLREGQMPCSSRKHDKNLPPRRRPLVSWPQGPTDADVKRFSVALRQRGSP